MHQSWMFSSHWLYVVVHGLEALLRQAFHLHEPLVREHGLDDDARAPRARHAQLVRLLRDQQPLVFQVLENLLASREALEPAILLRRVVVEVRIEP
jgi:hypothetical protein